MKSKHELKEPQEPSWSKRVPLTLIDSFILDKISHDLVELLLSETGRSKSLS